MICGCPLFSRYFCRRHVPHSSLGQPVALLQSQGLDTLRQFPAEALHIVVLVDRSHDPLHARPVFVHLRSARSPYFLQHNRPNRPAFSRAIALRSPPIALFFTAQSPQSPFNPMIFRGGRSAKIR